MKNQRRLRLGAIGLAAMSVGTLLAVHGCSGDEPGVPDTELDTETQEATTAADEDGQTAPISELPFVDAAANPRLLGEMLAKPTELGETAALHVKLPPPIDRKLADSLVRIVGPTDSPQVMFSSDALARLGVIPRSPGKEFFTAFASLSRDELERLKRDQDQIASGAFGQITRESIVSTGRSATARTINPGISPDQFQPGVFTPVNACLFRPVSNLANWSKSLFIRDPAVIQNPDRTWDPCTGAGTQGGVWTFAHLIREMATGSGKTPEDFVRDWLAMWLNNYSVNSDVVAARPQMFQQVIRPWAIASGVTATMITFMGVRILTLSGPLDLDIAPFRLLAIVNRIDLGETEDGPPGYNGHTTSRPTTPGELRFIFGVVQPSPWGAGTEASCGKKLFTTIFEYGVPGEGCTTVVKWAKKWTQLQAQPGFTAAYLNQLESMTESVVSHGAAPAKGNQNAINQIRTNEVALVLPSPTWELREFTLSDEDPASNTDTPSDGGLRKHTVAQTPNDGAFPSVGDPTINAYVIGPVTAGVQLPVSNPDHCQAQFTVPFFRGGLPFRGGNSLIGTDHYEASGVTLANAQRVCARFQFSLNTCNGCHRRDTATTGLAGNTSFTHVDPLSTIPVKMSKFLTGNGSGGTTFNVADTQFGTPAWKFHDLDLRYQRLWDISHCTSCVRVPSIRPQFIEELARLGPVPIDPGPENPFPFEVGPVTDLKIVEQLIGLRTRFAGDAVDQTVDFIRGIENRSH